MKKIKEGKLKIFKTLEKERVKIEDIRLGNYFRVNEGICRVIGLMVKEETKDQSGYQVVKFLVPNDDRVHSIHLDSESMKNVMFEPIKLTPNILNNNIKEASYEEEILSEAIHLDNGDIIGYDEKIIRWWMDGYYIYGEDYDDSITFPTRVEEDGNCKSGYAIWYLHEMQNIHRDLTRKNLTIENLK